jgi:hypothetical protein
MPCSVQNPDVLVDVQAIPVGTMVATVAMLDRVGITPQVA